MQCPNCGSEMGCNRYKNLHVSNPKEDDGSKIDEYGHNFYKSEKGIKTYIYHCFECHTTRYHT